MRLCERVELARMWRFLPKNDPNSDVQLCDTGYT